MSFENEIAGHFASIQTHMAGITGGTGWKILGQTVNVTVAAPNASQLESVGREMSMHGWEDRAVLVLMATRAQFTTEPRTAPQTAAIPPAGSVYGDCMIHSVNFEDPYHYIFIIATGRKRLP